MNTGIIRFKKTNRILFNSLDVTLLELSVLMNFFYIYVVESGSHSHVWLLHT